MALGFSVKRLNLPYLQGDSVADNRVNKPYYNQGQSQGQNQAKAKAKAIAKAKAKAKGLKGLKRGRKENRIRAEGLLTTLISRN